MIPCDRSLHANAALAVRPIVYRGMDVHKACITIAVLPDAARAPSRVDQLPNDLSISKRRLHIRCRAAQRPLQRASEQDPAPEHDR